jgi:quinoprotein glucose dehydrogenase
VEWPAYGHDSGGTRHSPAAQITPANVSTLRVAWTYRTGDYAVGESAARFEATPLMVDGTLYLSTPFGRVIALDPDSGRELWNYDPRIDMSGDYGDFASRGVSTWTDSERPRDARCARTIYVGTIDARLIALDSESGQPCAEFGRGGTVDLNRDILRDPLYRGEYQVTSPPAILRDLVIIGSAIADNARADAPSGVVRAFDARSGALRWSWDPIPRSGGAAAATWRNESATRTGAANAWSLISVDAERDLVFVPVGSASPDFYGGERLGANLYANSVVALRGATGEVVWHFQVVHHDLWDYDVPAQPLLTDWNGIPAVIQPTKMGHLFVLHRETGAPLVPVEERAVPKSDVPGEETSPTQPFPQNPALVPQALTANDAWGLTQEDRDWCAERIRALRFDGIFTPPSLQGTIIWPGNVGGSNWGSASIDASRGIVIAPTNRVAMVVTLIPRAGLAEARRTNRGAEISSQRGTPYAMKREILVTPKGIPCTPPPFGTLSGVKIGTGEILWEIPLGFTPGLAENLGSVNLGGAMSTTSGLAFVAATRDQHLRAFDVGNGRELWKAALPAGGNAMPMTYISRRSGRQYIVAAAGGHNRLGTKLGDHVVAFALDAPALALPRRALAKEWRGDLIVGRNRIPLVASLTESGDVVSGPIESKETGIAGTLHANRVSDRIDHAIDFTFPAKKCSGKIVGTLDLANDGSLLIGEVEVISSCSEAGREVGTLSMRHR